LPALGVVFLSLAGAGLGLALRGPSPAVDRPVAVPVPKEKETAAPAAPAVAPAPRPTATLHPIKVQLAQRALPQVEQVSLAITAERDCWLEVSADGKAVFQGTLAKGQARTFVAGDQLDVKFGRAEAVALELNGVPLGAAGSGTIRRSFTRLMASQALDYYRHQALTASK
ncbi:MAG TPA: DUF4115 domain-containing protein, partial [Limnochordia bacterium]|nr:DUF4115 domain-containing protein [Limnochordia bacterium]